LLVPRDVPDRPSGVASYSVCETRWSVSRADHAFGARQRVRRWWVPELIAFQDGAGDLEQMTGSTPGCSDRLTYIGGCPPPKCSRCLPAAGREHLLLGQLQLHAGVALRFYAAVRSGDRATAC